MCKKWTLTLALLILGCFTVWQSSSAHADYEDNLEIMDFIENNSTGTNPLNYGFMLKEVGGEILYGHNIEGINGQFYPASTIKVAHHLHTMLAWQNGNPSISLHDHIPYYTYSCYGPLSPEAGTEAILVMLNAMMQNSDNDRTNALQDYFGQANINNTLHNVVGMSSLTQLNHRFGCDGPNSNPANVAILKDFSLLYEGVANGSLLDSNTQELFEDVMLNETNNGFLQNRINAESNSLGLTDDEKDEFLADFAFIFKDGGYTWNGISYQSQAGYVTIPAKTCDGIQLRKYTFGAFVNEATGINGAVSASAVELMLESEIRNGLETFTTPLGCVNDWINIVPGLGYDTPVPIPGMSDAVLTVPSLGLGDGVWLGTAEFTPSTAPSGYIFARQGFELKEVGTSSQLARPLTLHTPYDESFVIDETSLRWFRFDEATGGWVDTVNVCQSGSYTQDTRLNTLEAPLCQTGQYALFGTVLNPQ